MNKSLRRITTIVLGLTLGWLAAGWVFADADPQTTLEHATASTGSLIDPHRIQVTDKGLTAAQELVPTENTSWYRPVVGIAIGLFIAAILLGIPAMKMRGSEPVNKGPEDDLAHASGHDSSKSTSHH